jgi:Holliday junction resolvase RusA-like endonuclease
MIKFEIPLAVQVSKNKEFILNLNNYRGTHRRVLTNAKNNFNEIVRDIGLLNKHERPIVTPAKFYYGYFPASNRSYDRDNVRSIVDKFLGDALIKCGMLKDDNYKLLDNSWLVSCPPDRENPRIEVIVEEGVKIDYSWPPSHL